MTSLVQEIERQRQGLRPGIYFGRLLQTIGLAGRAGLVEAKAYAAANFHGMPWLVDALITKGAVPAGSPSDAAWAGPTALPTPVGSELVKLLYPVDFITQLLAMGAVRAPFNIRFPRVNVGASAAWIAVGGPAPVTKQQLETVALGITKTGGIVVTTDEVARSTLLDVAAMLAADMTASIAGFRNRQFLQPTVTSSITFGLTQISSTGIDIDALTTDAGTAMAQLIDADIPLKNAVWLMSERLATHIARLRTTTKALAFPDMGPNGGEWFGLRCLTTSALTPIGSPTLEYFVLLDPSSVMIAQDDTPEITSSRQTTLEMDSAPSGGATTQTSLWQENLVAIRCLLMCNWVRRRDAAVAIVRGISL